MCRPERRSRARQQRPQPRPEHQASDQDRESGGHQDGSRGGVLGGLGQRLPLGTDEVHQTFHRRVHQLRRPHQGDRQGHPEPFAQTDPKGNAQQDGRRGRKDVESHVGFLPDGVPHAFRGETEGFRLQTQERAALFQRTSPAFASTASCLENISRSRSSVSWSYPSRWSSPCTNKNPISRSALWPYSSACARARGNEMTMSPRGSSSSKASSPAGNASGPSSPASRMGNDSTSVGASTPRKRRFSSRMPSSSVKVRDTTP